MQHLGASIKRSEAIRIIKGFIKEVLQSEQWYKQIEPSVSSILLYGSVAKEINRPDSDIDILIILPLTIEEKFTQGEYEYQYKGQTINIVLRSIERLRSIATKSVDKFQKEVFRDYIIIQEKGREVSKLLEKLNK